VTVDKAIELLGDLAFKRGVTFNEDFSTAVKLGIEALKYVKYRDNCPGINSRLLLPGETEE